MKYLPIYMQKFIIYDLSYKNEQNKIIDYSKL